MHLRMTLSGDKTRELWRSFMPRRNEVQNRANTDFVSMRVLDHTSGSPFAHDTEFEKWAAVEVENVGAVPEGMESYDLQGGKYAVFTHKGPASAGPRIFQHIFGTWIPSSEYELDSREHFEVLGADYRPDDPNAQEEVCIPIK